MFRQCGKCRLRLPKAALAFPERRRPERGRACPGATCGIRAIFAAAPQQANRRSADGDIGISAASCVSPRALKAWRGCAETSTRDKVQQVHSVMLIWHTSRMSGHLPLHLHDFHAARRIGNTCTTRHGRGLPRPEGARRAPPAYLFSSVRCFSTAGSSVCAIIGLVMAQFAPCPQADRSAYTEDGPDLSGRASIS
jgi:hypothetical protein